MKITNHYFINKKNKQILKYFKNKITILAYILFIYLVLYFL